LSGDGSEVLLAEEQGVRARSSGVAKEVEAEFGFGDESEGTLVLTTRRLVYVHEEEEEENLNLLPGGVGGRQIRFSDVQELESVARDTASVSISFPSIVSVKGKKGMMSAPKLEVAWNNGSKVLVTEFVQQITGGSRKRNLNDWGPVIERLKKGEQKVASLPPVPGKDTLEGKVLAVLGDMQEKGVLTIANQVGQRFKEEADSDHIQAACDTLVKSGFLVSTTEFKEDPFYRRISPLGADDLSG